MTMEKTRELDRSSIDSLLLLASLISKTQLGEVIGKNEARCTFQDHTLLHPSGFHARVTLILLM